MQNYNFLLIKIAKEIKFDNYEFLERKREKKLNLNTIFFWLIA